MFEIHFLVVLDLINIYTGTKTIKIEAFIANLQAHPVFRAAILNFEFLAGKPRATIWFPLFLNSAYSKTPRCKFSCFYPEVHDMAEKCHISAPLSQFMLRKCIPLSKYSTCKATVQTGPTSKLCQDVDYFNCCVFVAVLIILSMVCV